MNRLWITMPFVLWVSLKGYGQGWIEFENFGFNGSPTAPVYGPDPVNPNQQKWGNAPEASPPGTQTYSGPKLDGTNYSAEALYSLTPVADIFALNVEASVIPRSLSSFSFGGGFFFDINVVNVLIPNMIYTNGQVGVYLQVVAWDNGGGQLNSWPEAWNAAMAGGGLAVGWSKVFWQRVALGTTPPAGLSNFESFNIFVVPEPSMFVLVGLGGLGLRLFRRRK